MVHRKRKTYRNLALTPWNTLPWAHEGRQDIQKKTSKRRRRLSPYGKQLRARRHVAVLYGNLRHGLLKRFMKTAAHFRGERVATLLKLLESRLEMVLFRTNAYVSLEAVRHALRSRTITLNGRVMRYPGYMCQPGDIIGFHTHDLERLLEQKRLHPFPPAHLEIHYGLGKIVFLFAPQSATYPHDPFQDFRIQR